MGANLCGLFLKYTGGQSAKQSVQFTVDLKDQIEAKSLSHRYYFRNSTCGSGFLAAILSTRCLGSNR